MEIDREIISTVISLHSAISFNWFDLIHYVPSTSFQLCRDGSSLVEPVLKPHSHCADGATVHRDAGQPVYRDEPGHIS